MTCDPADYPQIHKNQTGEWPKDTRTKDRVRAYAREHPDATVRDIQAALGLSSPSVVQFHLKRDAKDDRIMELEQKLAAKIAMVDALEHEKVRHAERHKRMFDLVCRARAQAKDDPGGLLDLAIRAGS